MVISAEMGSAMCLFPVCSQDTLPHVNASTRLTLISAHCREAMRDVGAMPTLIRALSRAEVLNGTLKISSPSQAAYSDLLTALADETDPNASSVCSPFGHSQISQLRCL